MLNWTDKRTSNKLSERNIRISKQCGTTTEPHITLEQPVVVTNNKVKANPQVLKVASGGQGKGLA